jgi:hypothetical protein
MPPKIARNAGPAPEMAPGARQRTEVLRALQEICAGLERMQETEEGRAACREVAALLRRAREEAR